MRNSPPFIQSEGSLPCSQQHVANSFCEPTKSISHTWTKVLWAPF